MSIVDPQFSAQLFHRLAQTRIDEDQNEIFDVLEDLFKALPFNNYAELFYDKMHEHCSVQHIAALLELLVLYQPTAQKTICRTLEHWILGNDEQRISIALALKEIYLFADMISMMRAFRRVKKQFPELADACNHILQRRKQAESISDVEFYWMKVKAFGKNTED